ncbi:MAG: tRNA pseudouridine(55) synthase TruB [Flavobacteriaceae bacterium CG_4_8_14_3_um_filter_34_10]|nr:MAG: tRNA pseudouridine(55) synthase TruB [Flavobacteriaceae bacterium CG18_big_fil_WC_8_21_14_2_50_34_36]PIX09661.1 MAG: tRNA pseudouridine(55) synthase TruB [Flavobacteriaceae bacterium CG_4_8_14_3_um_filter_34_10]PIZ08731.1 MAG: tRNA pseudouridine(55) synthase TruB [Flavobacteriaceae bacterium CG_4_10_14_0_8_um_filter_34_31]PJC06197.1 MAG: tRNA pseudouridine(55) synthase TruB [Flavobacteriaceae bacterium CG_4_9_14_0_8_um_filter_34_30]
MSKENYQEGKILLIDKPLNWTSFQVVNKVRWLIRKQFQLKKIKVGHAGTLDPLATGLLLICTGKFTKQIDTYQGQEKEYTGTFTLGATTPSFDMETEIDQRFDIANLTKEKIKTVLPKFLGEIQQQPPVFSALKKDGKRLYEYARSGEEVEVAFRTVEISLFELTRIELPEIDFKVRCSKGTYIRSLAQDFGKVLDNGAYLSALRRTKIGDFSIKNAITMETFEKELTSSLS